MDRGYVARRLLTNAPILAEMIDGRESMEKAITPSGKRLPGPWVNSSQKNWPQKGRAPHRHGLCGSAKPSRAEAKQITGIPS